MNNVIVNKCCIASTHGSNYHIDLLDGQSLHQYLCLWFWEWLHFSSPVPQLFTETVSGCSILYSLNRRFLLLREDNTLSMGIFCSSEEVQTVKPEVDEVRLEMSYWRLCVMYSQPAAAVFVSFSPFNCLWGSVSVCNCMPLCVRSPLASLFQWEILFSSLSFLGSPHIGYRWFQGNANKRLIAIFGSFMVLFVAIERHLFGIVGEWVDAREVSHWHVKLIPLSCSSKHI